MAQERFTFLLSIKARKSVKLTEFRLWSDALTFRGLGCKYSVITMSKYLSCAALRILIYYSRRNDSDMWVLRISHGNSLDLTIAYRDDKSSHEQS